MTSRYMRWACAFLVVLASCFGGGDPNLTDAGKGKPEVAVDFPETTTPASIHEAIVRITNPGPGDIGTVAVAFAFIGPTSGQTEFPVPIVPLGAKGKNPAVVSVSPEPTGISDDGTVYTFGPLGGAPRLPEGDEVTIVFELRVPEEPGPAANSVQAYDGNEFDRARGVRMTTEVRR